MTKPFHVHENGDCGPGPDDDGTIAAGMAAGGHYDPERTAAHLGPEGQGHLGDLPFLTVQADGRGVGEAIAPRIRNAAQLRARRDGQGGDGEALTSRPLIGFTPPAPLLAGSCR